MISDETADKSVLLGAGILLGMSIVDKYRESLGYIAVFLIVLPTIASILLHTYDFIRNKKWK